MSEHDKYLEWLSAPEKKVRADMEAQWRDILTDESIERISRLAAERTRLQEEYESLEEMRAQCGGGDLDMDGIQLVVARLAKFYVSHHPKATAVWGILDAVWEMATRPTIPDEMRELIHLAAKTPCEKHAYDEGAYDAGGNPEDYEWSCTPSSEPDVLCHEECHACQVRVLANELADRHGIELQPPVEDDQGQVTPPNDA